MSRKKEEQSLIAKDSNNFFGLLNNDVVCNI
jgi:hypothetical protein